jgi:outer membrane protein, multidrug efflux system
MSRKLFLPVLILLFLMGGCTMAPRYTRPDNPVPANWPVGPAYVHMENATDESTSPASQLSWRDFITDLNLREIVETALKNNRDLRIATLHVEMARALYGIERVSLLPSVNAAGSMIKERVPGDLSSSGSAYTAEKYSVNLGITSWEIDFFGRIRSLKDQALEEYLATEQVLRGAHLMLVSSVAQAYLALAADQESLQLVSKTLAIQQDTYNLIKKRYNAGMISELDLKRAQSQVETAKGDVARYTQMVAQDENALNLLAGAPVRPELLPQNLNSVSGPRNISAGLSSEILLLRPDVLAAEHRLKAANAHIGAARAAFFPRIALTTALGTASADLSGLFKSGSKTWTFAPSVVMPVFDARTWFAYDATKIEKEISIAQYEKAIQTAFREVSDALAEKGMIGERVAAQQSLVDALQDAHRLSLLRYEKGVDSYLSVLDSQRYLYGAQQGLIMLRFAQMNNQMTLYKTLGGGEGRQE